MTSKAGNVSWTDQTDEVPSSSKEEEHKKDKGYKTFDEVSLAELSTAVGSDLKTLRDDDSDMETHIGLDTRSVGSKSRISSARGPMKSQKDHARMVAHLAKQGITWTPKVDEASSNSTKRQTELWTTPENRRAGLVAATGLHTAKGSVAQHVYAEHLASINIQGRLEREVDEPTPAEKCEDVVQFRGKMESSFQKQFLEWDPAQKQDKCTLCSKFANEAHLTSLGHLKNLEGAAMGNMLAGNTLNNRRFKKTDSPGCPSPPTKANLLKFWGDELPNMAQIAEQMFKQKGKIYIDNKEKNFLEPKDVLGCRLGIVRYSGHGKYAQNTFEWYDELPDCDEVASDDWLDKIDKKGNTKGGWWPVVAYNMSQETTRQRAPWNIPKPEAKIILVTCFYQIMEGRIVGWWIFLE